ncbi:MAG TPA: DMT family transporter [Chitinophagaceae bacterium]|nr:DMT family transporter [Chitinophagaceae bacterium]
MRKAFLQLHLAVFLAGFTGVLGRLITLNEGLIVWYRLLLTAATMWLLFYFRKKIEKIPAGLLLRIMGVGCIAALHWVTFYGSVKYANVSVALVCFSAIGFFTALLEPLIFRTRVQPVEVALGLLTIFAVFLIFHFDARYQTGIILGIISAFLGSLFPVYNRAFLQKTNIETMLTWQQTGGLLALSCILPVYLQYSPADKLLPNWQDWGWLLLLAWVCSVWAFQLSSAALKKLSAFTVNLSYNLEPVYGILLAFAIYHENRELGYWFYAGLAIILAVLIIHAWWMMMRHRQAARTGSSTVV